MCNHESFLCHILPLDTPLGATARCDTRGPTYPVVYRYAIERVEPPLEKVVTSVESEQHSRFDPAARWACLCSNHFPVSHEAVACASHRCWLPGKLPSSLATRKQAVHTDAMYKRPSLSGFAMFFVSVWFLPCLPGAGKEHCRREGNPVQFFQVSKVALPDVDMVCP